MGAQDQRPRFYEGQYLGAADLSAVVDYLRATDARHALGAHTWGIAIGLYLVERPAPGGADRREVILTPGVAWDGFGRAIVVTRPARLPEDLFKEIPYDASLDGTSPARGRAVRVWLNYKETAAQQPAPGFESCSDEDQNARVAESFEFVVGAYPPGPNRQGNVVIGTETLPAEEALTKFDAAAQPLYDASVPHQTFPSDKRVPRWLVPVGFVRWVARDGDVGYFVSRDGVPEYRLKDCTRGFRRYIGAVVENVVAADGAIVLQRRDEDPRQRHKLAWLLNCGGDSEALLSDLAWVEGNLRVVGDAKLAGGRLLLRDADGEDEGVPIYLQRVGDDPNLETKKCCEDLDAAGGSSAEGKAKAPRELRVAIGKKGQNEHRLIVGPEEAAAKPGDPPTLSPRFVVLSGTGKTDNKDSEGRAGVNTRDPNAALEVKGDWNGQDGAIRVAGQQPAIRFEGASDVGSEKWLVQTVASPQSGAFQAARWDSSDSKWKAVLHMTPAHHVGVGIAATTPRNPLAVKAQPLDTASVTDQAIWDELVSLEDRDGSTKWHVNFRIAGSQKHLNFAETGVADGRLFLQAGGNVGIGTIDPQGRLTINGKVQPAQGQMSFFTAAYDVEYDGGDDRLFIWHQAPAGITSFLGAKIAIGGTSPYAALSVRGTGGAEELVSFESAAGATKWHINQKLAAAPVKGFNIAETGVADGRLFIQEGGNVGIGTYNPQEKLHVAGNFLRVEGAGGEQAYIGGDGSTSGPGKDVQIGSSNSAVSRVHLWNTGYGGWMSVRCSTLYYASAVWTSDARLKRDVKPLEGSLARVSRLRGVSFEWDPAAAKGPTPASPSRQLGVIAQEVAAVLPEAVVDVDESTLGVSLTPMLALLIESVKELKAEVDELRGEVKKLSGGAPKKKAPRG